MNELRDPSVERLYGEASREQPGAAADAAILALAREAAAQAAKGRKPAGSPNWARRWSAPLALAASMVLAVGIVSRIGLEPPDGPEMEAGRAGDVVPASAPPVAAPATTPPVAEPSGAAISAKERGDMRSAKARSSDMAGKAGQNDATVVPPAERQPIAQSAPSAPSPAIAKAEGPMPGSTPAADAESRQSAVMSRAPLRAPELAHGTATGAAAPPATSGEMRRDAAPAPAIKSAQRVARENAEAVVQDSGKVTALPILSEAREATLTPESWISYILDLRRSGHHEAADASLKRFRNRHPAYPVLPQAEASVPPSSGEAK